MSSTPNSALLKMVEDNQTRAKWAIDTALWQNNIIGILHAVAALAADPTTDRDLLAKEAKDALVLVAEYIEKSARPHNGGGA